MDHNPPPHPFVAVFTLRDPNDEAHKAQLDILRSWGEVNGRSWRHDPVSATLELSFPSAEDRDFVLRCIWAVEHIRPVRT